MFWLICVEKKTDRSKSTKETVQKNAFYLTLL